MTKAEKSAYNAAYHRAHREEKRAYDAQRPKRPYKAETGRVRVAKWREKNRERFRAYTIQDYADHRAARHAAKTASRKRYPEKEKARTTLNAAVQRGLIVKPDNCTRCDQPASGRRMQAHHPDYLQPLAVTWLCSLCHGKLHRKDG